MPGVPREAPLSETQFLIMSGLISPAHGYGIMQHVEEITDGAISIGPGTMYGTLKKLVKKSLISQIDPDLGNERRILYRLTKEGLSLLEIEIDRLCFLSGIAEKKRVEMKSQSGDDTHG